MPLTVTCFMLFFFSHEISWVRSGTDLSQFLRFFLHHFQCRLTVAKGPNVLAVGADGGCLDIFTLLYHFFSLSPSLSETARYRLK